MTERPIRALIALVAVMLGLPFAAPAGAAPARRYDVVDFGALQEGTSSIVRGLSDTDDIVGGSGTFGVGHRGFLLNRSRIEKIEGRSHTDWSAGRGINAAGVVVGSANTDEGLRAFARAPDGTVRDLAPLPGDTSSEAFAINRRGQIVGVSSGAGGIMAVLWPAGATVPQPLGRLPGADASRAVAINDGGAVVGTSGGHAFLWTPRRGLEDLGTLPGASDSEAAGINAAGAVVGFSGFHAFLWTRAGGMRNLGTLPAATMSRARAINDAGEVVGMSATPQGTRAFIWTETGGMQDLNFLLTASAFVLDDAVAINTRGAILAVGHDDTGHRHDHEVPIHVFLLEPRP